MKALLMIAMVIGLLGVAGCTATKALYQSNEQLLAGLAGSVTGPACASAVSGLQPGEAAPACGGLTACAVAICATPQGH